MDSIKWEIYKQNPKFYMGFHWNIQTLKFEHVMKVMVLDVDSIQSFLSETDEECQNASYDSEVHWQNHGTMLKCLLAF